MPEFFKQALQNFTPAQQEQLWKWMMSQDPTSLYSAMEDVVQPVGNDDYGT